MACLIVNNIYKPYSINIYYVINNFHEKYLAKALIVERLLQRYWYIKISNT